MASEPLQFRAVRRQRHELSLGRASRTSGLTEDLPPETLAALAEAKVPDEFAHLDELMMVAETRRATR